MLCRWMTSTLAIPLIAGLMPGLPLDAAVAAQLVDRPPSLDGVKTFSAPLNEGNALIGIRPSGWTARDWINSEPLALEALRGKVVLVRWWTAPDCPFCEASAPALNDFWRRYGSRGLVVVGFYHHKSSKPLRLATVKTQSRKFGFEFPVAIDPDGKTLRRTRRKSTKLKALHVVSAWAGHSGITLGQVAVAAKSNEITAMSQVLQVEDLHEKIVTTDAMGCQKEIAQSIVAGGGDYIVAVKDNQPTLHAELQAAFAQAAPPPPRSVRGYRTTETGHGRHEHRCAV